jgi:2-polyprenyl-3-methyl-5-hydroxy-6-metoxy-1,4-benzoquinol methylase
VRSVHDPVSCRLCGASGAVPLGPIPDSDYFAGRVLQYPLEGGELFRCESCLSMFRHPVMTPTAYLELYVDGIAEAWSAGEDRQDLAIIRKLLVSEVRLAKILDVGCGAGGFLSSLPERFEKFGLDPSGAATAMARRRGMRILGGTLADLPPSERFDVITMIDIIEHVESPANLLDIAVSHLSPGGLLIVSTGDPGNVFWCKVFRSRFWYSYFPEHISFPSLKYFELWQRDRGLEPPMRVRVRYRRLPFWLMTIHFAAQVAYLVSPGSLDVLGRCVQAIRRAPRPRRRYFAPVSLGVFKDHHVVVMRRPIA